MTEAISFSIELYHGIKSGCELFADAASMPEDLDSLRLQLVWHYCRLVDWADMVELTRFESTNAFSVEVKANRLMVNQTLVKLRDEYQSLTSLTKRYLESQNDTGDAVAGAEQDPNAEKIKIPQDRVDVSRKDLLDATDLAEFQDLMSSSSVPLPKQKHSRGTRIFLNILHAGKEVLKHPKRLKWAYEDKAKFETGVQNVKQRTDVLRETSDVAVQDTLLKMGSEICRILVSFPGYQDSTIRNQEQMLELQRAMGAEINQLQARLESVARVSTSVQVVVSQNRSESETADWEKLLKFHMFRHEIDQHGSQLPEILAIKHELENFVILSDRGPKERTIARLGPQYVWLEWKAYQPVPSDDPDPTAPPVVDGQVVKMVRRLTAMLQSDHKPSEIRIPHGLGYIHDPARERFGFVFEIQGQDAPWELRQKIRRAGIPGSREGAMPLFARINIARTLSSSLLYLHAVGWLHKDINSSSVLLRPDSENGIVESFLSGFEYARSDDQGFTSTVHGRGPAEDLYSHPEYQGVYRENGFRKTFDIYSLGIVLIEIAYWQSIASIMGFETPAQNPIASQRPQSPGLPGRAVSPEARGQVNPRNRSPTKTLPLTAKNVLLVKKRIETEPHILNGVRNAMGGLYCKAVEACIRGDFGNSFGGDESDPRVGFLILEGYKKSVVDVLGSIVI